LKGSLNKRPVFKLKLGQGIYTLPILKR